jgi:hypothetical protein
MSGSEKFAGKREGAGPAFEAKLEIGDPIRPSSNAPDADSDGAMSAPEDEIIYELTDIVEEGSPKTITVAEFNSEIIKRVTEITERIAREIVPVIAERIIREEIDKLKASDE